MTTRKRLCSIKGITEAKVDKIKVQERTLSTSLFFFCPQEASAKLLVCQNLGLDILFQYLKSGCRVFDCT